MLPLLLGLQLVPPGLALGPCLPAAPGPPPAGPRHLWAEDGLQVSRVAFSSCFHPPGTRGDTFWSQVRAGAPDLWLWLGDNAYSDGYNMEHKRRMYDVARTEPSYVAHGPVREGGKIPVLATWDDHDCAYNDRGGDYPCLKESQDEFVRHFSIPPSEPSHWAFPLGQQQGVYTSRLFLQPGSSEPGLQVILLDARSGRSPTRPPGFAACHEAGTKMLGPDQWLWLEQELTRQSAITVIASGVQVLPPTDRTRPAGDHCAEDSHSGGGDTFEAAIAAVGEAWPGGWPGTPGEEWGEVPQERARLLGLAQRAVNNGHTRAVIFLSGDQHWGELLAKRMPDSPEFGPAQVLYEVTASRVYEEWQPVVAENGNRLRARSADWRGEGPFTQACVFPFTHQGAVHTSCVPGGSGDWCATRTDDNGAYMPGHWGRCAPLEDELAQAVFSNSSRTCGGSPFYICSAQALYGYLEVDFPRGKVRMGVRTPEEREEIFHEISF